MSRLLYLDRYPELCRVALSARGDVCAVEIEQAKRIERADCLATQATVAAAWEWKPWQAVLTIGAALVVGVATGFLAGMTSK